MNEKRRRQIGYLLMWGPLPLFLLLLFLTNDKQVTAVGLAAFLLVWFLGFAFIRGWIK